MFRFTFTTIFRGLMSCALCRYYVEFRGCEFVMFLYSMRPYVIIVGCECVCVCVSGVPVLVYDQISPRQELQTHTHTHTLTTDDNDIRPHTVQEHNERTSTEFNLVTA
jgi:hypothetical protein